jgi:hypothetical protein
VLGDPNDEPTAATTQIPPGSELGTAGFDRPDRGDGAQLWNLAPLIPAERRFSRAFRGRGELIDHILASHALVNRIDQVDTGTRPPSITEDPTARRDEPASDHAPSSRASISTDASTRRHPPVPPGAQSRRPLRSGRLDRAPGHLVDQEGGKRPIRSSSATMSSARSRSCLVTVGSLGSAGGAGFCSFFCLIQV